MAKPTRKTTKADSFKKVSIDNLSLETMPARLLEIVNSTELTIEEARAWYDNSNKMIEVTYKDQELLIKVNTKLKVKKLVATIGGSVAALWGTLHLAIPYIQSWF